MTNVEIDAMPARLGPLTADDLSLLKIKGIGMGTLKKIRMGLIPRPNLAVTSEPECCVLFRDALKLKRSRLLLEDEGCYAWIANRTGKIARIGKSKNMRSRITQYFQGKERLIVALRRWAEKERGLKRGGVGLKVWYTSDSDGLEFYLLSKYKPQFNGPLHFTSR